MSRHFAEQIQISDNMPVWNQWRFALSVATAIASSGRTTRPRVFKQGDSWYVTYHDLYTRGV